VRRLIINADDFGLTPGINRAVAEAHVEGVLTSATAMAAAPAFREAAEIARQLPRLSVGCHVVLVDGEPLTAPSRLLTLVPRGSARFQERVGPLALRALTGQLRQDEIEAEGTAQFRMMQSTDFTVTHFDTHKHLHVFPAVLEPLLRAARACGVGAVRNPFEPAASLPARKLAKRRNLWKRYAQTHALRRFQPAFRRLVSKAGLKTTDGTLGIAATGLLDQSMLRDIVEAMPEGTWELVCHPGYADDALRTTRTRLRESREVEQAVLTSPETRQLMENAGIELTSYREL
jgi:hopanoid biosynthesis associated protein HpnK